MWDPSHPLNTHSLGKLRLLPPMTSDACRHADVSLSPLPGCPLQTCQPWTTLQTPQTHPGASQLPLPQNSFLLLWGSLPNPSIRGQSQNLGFIPDSPSTLPSQSPIFPSPSPPQQLSVALLATGPASPPHRLPYKQRWVL